MRVEACMMSGGMENIDTVISFLLLAVPCLCTGWLLLFRYQKIPVSERRNRAVSIVLGLVLLAGGVACLMVAIAGVVKSLR